MSLKKQNLNHKRHKNELHFGQYVGPHSSPKSKSFSRNQRRLKSGFFKRKVGGATGKKVFGITLIPFVF